MTNEPLTRMIERLPRAEPDAARAERVRARCRAALARQHPPARAGARSHSVTTPKWQPALVGLFCLAYLTEVVRHALELYGMHWQNR